MQKTGRRRKIDQANDRQTEKKRLAEAHGRCLGGRLASPGELNTRLDAHCICVFVFVYLCIWLRLFRCPGSQRW